MRIDYTVQPDGATMTHEARRLRYETRCDGCGETLEASYVTVLTDRSGSEQAALHLDNAECLAAALAVYVPGGGPCPVCERNDPDGGGEWHEPWCYQARGEQCIEGAAVLERVLGDGWKVEPV